MLNWIKTWFHVKWFKLKCKVHWIFWKITRLEMIYVPFITWISVRDFFSLYYIVSVNVNCRFIGNKVFAWQNLLKLENKTHMIEVNMFHVENHMKFIEFNMLFANNIYQIKMNQHFIQIHDEIIATAWWISVLYSCLVFICRRQQWHSFIWHRFYVSWMLSCGCSHKLSFDLLSLCTVYIHFDFVGIHILNRFKYYFQCMITD